MTKKLLVIEDSAPIAKVIKKIATSLKYQVVIANTFAAVKEYLYNNGNDFFAATIDYSLPDALDGEAIPYVLSLGIPSVVMTAKMDDNTRQKILAQPVIDYIPKENNHAFSYLKRILQWQLTNSKQSILVVDDSMSARNHIYELLRRRNFTVYKAEHGQEALTILAAHKDIKMVITDLEMPVMDGIELTNKIRKHHSREQIAIIGISGATNGVHSARFIKNGADDFLRKPFCPEEFYCRITQTLDSLNNIEHIQKAANTDFLTELPNRRAFIRDAAQAIQYFINNQIPYAFAMLDIDHFKKVNDNYGHDAGDHILKVMALYLRKFFGSAQIARLGGEEFAIVASGDNEEEIFTRLDNFRRTISAVQVSFDNKKINFSVSIGVVFNSDALLESQMSLADEALYFSKENGRNLVSVSK